MPERKTNGGKVTYAYNKAGKEAYRKAKLKSKKKKKTGVA